MSSVRIFGAAKDTIKRVKRKEKRSFSLQYRV